jgi:DNA end-binding protein Ku
VILFDENTSAANARSTHAVDIFAFIEAQEIPADYFENLYVLAPAPGGERVYAMLRETLRMTHKIGIAYVVIQERPQLAALLPRGEGLVLNTLRWAGQDGSTDLCEYPFAEEDVFHLSDNELQTAERMADSMDGMWDKLPAQPQYGGAELQAFGGAEEEDEEDGEDRGLLLDTLDEDEELEDHYLASLLIRTRRHPLVAASSRSGRRPAGSGGKPHAIRPRLRARRH